MNQKQKQEDKVLAKLKADSEISNLWAIRNNIWRLGAVIHRLKAKGYHFKGSYLIDKKGKLTKVYNYKLI